MELPELAPGAWSVCVLDADSGADSGEVLAAHEPERLLATASVAKVFALVELAARLEDGRVAPDRLLDRRSVTPVADSGLWQRLRADRLPVEDVAVLVGSVSDNLATNVLLDLLGLGTVQDRAASLVAGGSTLHDVVRDQRGPSHPERLSSGCARDWARLMGALHRGEVVSAGVSGRVLGWLSTGTDLSMVAAALDLDPLAHEGLSHKTGTDTGVRADVGLVTRGGRSTAYAVVCNWEGEGLHRVLATMRAVGERLPGIVASDG